MKNGFIEKFVQNPNIILRNKMAEEMMIHLAKGYLSNVKESIEFVKGFVYSMELKKYIERVKDGDLIAIEYMENFRSELNVIGDKVKASITGDSEHEL